MEKPTLEIINNVPYAVMPDGRKIKYADILAYNNPGMQYDDVTLDVIVATPATAEDASRPARPEPDVFGDTTMEMAAPYFKEAAAAWNAPPEPTYFTDPVMGSLEQFGQGLGNVGVAGLNAAMGGLYGGMGLLSELVPQSREREKQLAYDLAGMFESAGPAPEGRMLGALSDAGAARAVGRDVVDRLNQRGPMPTTYSNPIPGLLGGADEVSVESVLRSKYPDVKISVSGNPERGYTLNKIDVPKAKRESGIGTAVMNDLVSLADQQGAILKLSPAKDFGGSVPRLKDFYARFGFVQNKGKNADYSISESMYRTPSQPASPSLPTPRNDAEAMARDILQLRAEGRAADVTDEMMAAADPQYMFYNTPLPMDYASRMERAEARGGVPAFRGDRNLSEFMTGQGKQTGVGVTVSDSPAVANSYVGQGEVLYPLMRFGGKGVSVDAANSSWKDINPYSEVALSTGRRMGLDEIIDPREYLDDVQFMELDHFMSTGERLPDSDFGYSTDDLARIMQKRGADYTSFNNVVDPGAYGRFKTPESNLPATTTMVANPANIRSRFARFDPKFAHLRNLSAAVTAGLPLGLLAMQSDQEQY